MDGGSTGGQGGTLRRRRVLGGGQLWLSPVTVADHLELSVVEQLLQNVCLLLASRTRDVVKAALGFLKVTLLLVDTKLLAKHVQAMVRSHMGCPEEWGCLGQPGSSPAAPCFCLGVRGTTLILVTEKAVRRSLSCLLAGTCQRTPMNQPC